MKKLLLAAFALSFFASTSFAQEERAHSIGEVKLNFLNTILLGSVELGYEHFLGKDQSIAVEAHFNDRFAYISTPDGRDFNATSLQVSYNFYFDSETDGQVYIFPYLKYRFGDFSESVDQSQPLITSMNSAILGLGAGYKWVFNDQFAMGPYVSIARGFSEEVNDRFSAIEFKAGFSIGYRF
jgi:outer membrane receptor for Fe3+-dicitrate